jgi:hypothetical protein
MMSNARRLAASTNASWTRHQNRIAERVAGNDSTNIAKTMRAIHWPASPADCAKLFGAFSRPSFLV